MKSLWCACALVCFAPAVAGANDVHWLLEPAHLSVEHLDAAFESRLGHAGRETVRIAYGVAVRWNDWSLGMQQGHASAHVDFGLLEDSSTRLNRSDTTLELRWRSPRLVAGWRLQPAIGFGRLDLRYRPETLQFEAGGQSVQVSLDPEARWTRHVSAELLHALSGQTHLIVRAAWRVYALELGTPTGNEIRSMSDVQLGLAFRVQPF